MKAAAAVTFSVINALKSSPARLEEPSSPARVMETVFMDHNEAAGLKLIAKVYKTMK